MARQRLAVGLLGGLLLLGCAQRTETPEGYGPPPEKLAFPTHGQNGGPNAEAEARLIQKGRCLYLSSGGERSLLIWPDRYRPATRGSTLVILDQEGSVVGRVGEPVAFGGGYVGRGVAADVAGAEIPEACETPDYWFVHEIELLS